MVSDICFLKVYAEGLLNSNYAPGYIYNLKFVKYCWKWVKKQPRLQGALSLKQKGPLKGVNGNRGTLIGDSKSEEEKDYFLSAIVKFSKLALGPRLGKKLLKLYV